MTYQTPAQLKARFEGGDVPTQSDFENFIDSVHQQTVDFQAFSPAGNGTTDDTTVIQSALDSGQTQFLLTGTYLVSELEVPADVTIYGRGGEFKFVLGSTPSGLDLAARCKLIGVNFDVSGVDSLGTSAVIDIEGDDVEIDGCLFDGKTVGPSAFKFNYCVRLSNTLSNQRARITNNRFFNTYFGVIRQLGTTGDASYSKISDNAFIGLDKGDAIQINVGADVDILIRGNIINDVSEDGITNAGMGIGLAGDEGSGGGEASEIRRVIINGNTVGNTERGIHVEGCNKITISDNIVNTVPGDGTEAGIQIYASDEFVIADNIVTDCPVGGIQVEVEGTDQSRTGTITGNLVKDCPRGIHIDTDTVNSSVAISGNIVQNSSSRGISVQGGADYTIAGNGVEDSVLAYRIDAESNANTIVFGSNLSTNTTTDRSFLNVTNSSLYVSGNNFVSDSAPLIAFAADDTTPDVSKGNRFKTVANSGATAITNLDGGVDGQLVMIKGGSTTNATTIADSGSFRLAGAITLNTNTVITLLYDATLVLWTEQSRSVN